MKEREKRDPSSSYFRDSASATTFFALLVNDLIVISKELSHPFLLFLGGNALFQKVLETLMVCLNLEALPQEIWTPQLNGMKNCQHFFFINGFPRFFSDSCLLVKAKGRPSYIRTVPIPFPKVSHSNTNVFVKSGRARTGVVHMVFFKIWKS